jgi:antirestriction protein
MNEGLTQAHPDYSANQAETEAIEAIEQAGHNLDAVGVYRHNLGEQYTPLLDWEDWIDEFEESYQGQFSTREFAEQLADEAFIPADSPQWMFTYFDYEKFERDLFMGDYWESDGYIFRSL